MLHYCTYMKNVISMMYIKFYLLWVGRHEPDLPKYHIGVRRNYNQDAQADCGLTVANNGTEEVCILDATAHP